MLFFNFILLAMIIYRIFKWIWKEDKSKQNISPSRQSDHVVEEMNRDPVCGTYVPASLAVTLNHNGATVYFCSNACRDKFSENTKTN